MEELTLLRLMLGDYSDEDILTDAILELILAEYEDFDEGIKIYYSGIRTLEYLMAQYAKDGGEMREKEGDLEVEVDNSAIVDSISALISYYRAHPPEWTGVAPAMPTMGFGASSPVKVRARTRNMARRNSRRSPVADSFYLSRD